MRREKRGDGTPGNICGFTELHAKPYSGYQPAQDAMFLPSLVFFFRTNRPMEKRNALIKNVHMQVGGRSAKVPSNLKNMD